MGKIAALLMVVGLMTVTILNAVEITQDDQTNITSHESAWQEPDGPCRGDKDCPEGTVCYAETCESCLAFSDTEHVPQRCKDVISVTPALNDSDAMTCKAESDCQRGWWCFKHGGNCESCDILSLEDQKIHCPYYLEEKEGESGKDEKEKDLSIIIGVSVGTLLLLLVIAAIWEWRYKKLRHCYQKLCKKAPVDNDIEKGISLANGLQNTEPPGSAGKPLLTHVNDAGDVNKDQNEKAEQIIANPEPNPTDSEVKESDVLIKSVQPEDFDKSPSIFPA